MEIRDKIINQSFIHFIRCGYKATTLKTLEQLTGLTKGAFYYYFKDKDEILRAGIDRYFGLLNELDEATVAGTDTLKEYIDTFIQYQITTSDLSAKTFGISVLEILFFQLVLEVETEFPEYREKIYTLLNNRQLLWHRIINKAQEKKEIRSELDGWVLARNFMSVSISMLNVDVNTTNFHMAFIDMKQQFEQYYTLIRI